MGTRTIDMTTGGPARHILRFAVPLILTNVGQQFYMIADAAIVGRGADALFIAEPASWLGAMLCVFLPYFYYRKQYLGQRP